MADIIPNVVVSMPSQLFTLARSFKAAANGKIYIGKIDTDPTIPSNQIQVYIQNEDGSTVPVSQPITINSGGYPVYMGQISKFVTVEGHSMAIYDSYLVQQFYFPNVLKYDPDQFRGELASSSGASNVGTSFGDTVQDQLDYTGGKFPSPSNIQPSLKGAIDRLTERLVYAELYGVKGDGITDNTDSLMNLSLAVNSMTDPIVRIIFPQGIITCGRQSQSGGAGAGYSFRPVYESIGLRGYLSIDGRKGITILDGYGATIKLTAGLKSGSFDPSTGLPAPDQVGSSPNRDFQAQAGHGISVLRCQEVHVIGLKLDGSAATASVGGKWGDSGWQCLSFGVWCAENDFAFIKDVKSYDWVCDSVYLAQSNTWAPSVRGQQKGVLIEDCEFKNSRRQGITIAGGQFIDINRTVIKNIGRYADSAGVFYSAPEACIDIETEASTVQDVTIRNSRLLYGYYTLLASAVDSTSKRCTLTNCLLRNNSNYTSVLSAIPGLVFNDCTIEGGGFDFSDITASTESNPMFFRCVFSNNIDGSPVSGSRMIGKVSVIKDCSFRALMHAGLVPIFAVTTPAYPSFSTFTGNMLTIYGDKSTAPKNAAGRISVATVYGMRDIDLTIADGTSGAEICEVSISGCTANTRGVSSGSARVVNQDGNTISVGGGKWILPGADVVITSQNITPAVSGGHLGDDARRFGDIYVSNGGIHMQSPNGTKYTLTISNSGAVSVVAG